MFGLVELPLTTEHAIGAGLRQMHERVTRPKADDTIQRYEVTTIW